MRSTGKRPAQLFDQKVEADPIGHLPLDHLELVNLNLVCPLLQAADCARQRIEAYLK